MTRIGTPLSPSATKVLFLGAGELGKEVVIELQRFGVEVIACDRYPNAPGMQVAHRAHVFDMTDTAALRGVIEQEQPDLIVPEIEAIATDELAAIEAEGLATVIPTARATQLTMDREGIRRLTAETLGLKTSPYAFASDAESLAAEAERIGYPVFVKPVMSSSGKGQSKVDSAADIAAAWDHALTAGRGNQVRVIVEGAVDFDYEITLLTVRHAGGTAYCAPVGHRQESGDYVESWQPQPMSETALARAQEMARNVTDNIGGLGVFGVELFVKGDTVWFSEVSPRPHDTGLVTLTTQDQSEFALHARAHSRPARRYQPQPSGRQRRHLWRDRGRRRGIRKCRRRPRRARHTIAPVRQTGLIQEAPHGRRHRPRRNDRNGARKGGPSGKCGSGREGLAAADTCGRCSRNSGAC